MTDSRNKILKHIIDNYVGMKTTYGEIVDVEIPYNCVRLLVDAKTDINQRSVESICNEIEKFYGIRCAWLYLKYSEHIKGLYGSR